MVDGYNLCFVCFFCIVLLVCFCSTLLLKYKSPQGREGKHINLTHTQGTHKAHTHTHTHTQKHTPTHTHSHSHTHTPIPIISGPDGESDQYPVCERHLWHSSMSI